MQINDLEHLSWDNNGGRVFVDYTVEEGYRRYLSGITRLKGTWIEEEEENKMKLIIYYDNGKSFTATNVSKYEQKLHELVYKQEKQKNKIKIVSEYRVPLVDIIAYTVIRDQVVTTFKLKPCAKVDVKVSK